MRFSLKRTPTASENLDKMREFYGKMKSDVPASGRKLYNCFHHDMRLIERVVKLKNDVVSVAGYQSAMSDDARSLVKSAAQFATQKYANHYFVLKVQTAKREQLDILWLVPATFGGMLAPLLFPSPFALLVVGTVFAAPNITFTISDKLRHTRMTRLESIGMVSCNYKHNSEAVAEPLAYSY